MVDVHLFAEDEGHERIVGELIRRVGVSVDRPAQVRSESVRGGHGRVVHSLRQYARQVRAGARPLPPLLVVATDANCKGYADRLGVIRDAADELADRLVCAVPDPHVERWLLVDSHAFKSVLGRGCAAPDQKCDRDRYKELLAQAVTRTGREIEVGGLEHAAALIAALDLSGAHQLDESLGRFVDDLAGRLRAAPV